MGHAVNAVVSPISCYEMMARGQNRGVQGELSVFDYFAVLVGFASYFLTLFIPHNKRPILLPVLVVYLLVLLPVLVPPSNRPIQFLAFPGAFILLLTIVIIVSYSITHTPYQEHGNKQRNYCSFHIPNPNTYF